MHHWKIWTTLQALDAIMYSMALCDMTYGFPDIKYTYSNVLLELMWILINYPSDQNLESTLEKHILNVTYRPIAIYARM